MVQDASQLAQGAQQAVAPAPIKVKADPSVLAVHSKSALVGAGYFLASMGILLALWIAVQKSFAHDLPTPAATFTALKTLLAHPYFVKDDGTMGVINLVYASLVRVFIGFGLGSLIAIPLGVLMGSSDICKRLIDPISQVMRPVSPLAWFPLAQVMFLTLGQGAMPPPSSAPSPSLVCGRRWLIPPWAWRVCLPITRLSPKFSSFPSGAISPKCCCPIPSRTS